MKKKKKPVKMGILAVSLFALVFVGIYIQDVLAIKNIELMVDGKNITESANPVIKDGRTLIPIRSITEELGGEIFWNEENRSVKIKKDDDIVTLKIDSRLITYGEDEKTYALSDISPTIIEEHTYVPLRLVGNALGISVTWDEEDRNIYVDSKGAADVEKAYDMEIITPISGQVVEGEIPLQVIIGDIKKEAKEIKYLLLDPKSAKGFIIERGELLTGGYTYSPKIGDTGEKVIVAALYDKAGEFIAGDAMGVKVKPSPKVSIDNVEEGQILDGEITLKPNMNFSPRYVKYQITNLSKDEVVLSEASDPYGSYSWTPMVHESGDYEFKIIAYDEDEKAYESEGVKVKVYPPYRLSLTGVKANMKINGSVNLGAFRNFHVSETQFILKDVKTSNEEVLSTLSYGNYTWVPGLEYNGEKQIFVRVKDTRGQIHESEKIDVTLEGRPELTIKGIGPKQIISSDMEIYASSNVELDSVEYILENPKDGNKRSLTKTKDYKSKFKFSPESGDEGERIFRAKAMYNGNMIVSEDIPVKIYLGKLYGPTPIVEKDKFLDLASNLAKESYRDTNMSAALQTAQAILETGWGQSVPTDKYTGKLSNNLFGIKGRADEGAVISNTWEEYNGEVYRVDAEFRAYKDIKDSWKDHKSLLLDAQRYSIFRDVMYDSTKGAWAIRRAGYATDSKYPLKLIDIIDRYNLSELDKVGI
jgi:copper amine oxidase-like protein/mannosyl-glycoprotein endo-beta-N-acetylglucosaminidase